MPTRFGQHPGANRRRGVRSLLSGPSIQVGTSLCIHRSVPSFQTSTPQSSESSRPSPDARSGRAEEQGGSTKRVARVLPRLSERLPPSAPRHPAARAPSPMQRWARRTAALRLAPQGPLRAARPVSRTPSTAAVPDPHTLGPTPTTIQKKRDLLCIHRSVPSLQTTTPKAVRVPVLHQAQEGRAEEQGGSTKRVARVLPRLSERLPPSAPRRPAVSHLPPYRTGTPPADPVQCSSFSRSKSASIGFEM